MLRRLHHRVDLRERRFLSLEAVQDLGKKWLLII